MLLRLIAFATVVCGLSLPIAAQPKLRLDTVYVAERPGVKDERPPARANGLFKQGEALTLRVVLADAGLRGSLEGLKEYQIGMDVLVEKGAGGIVADVKNAFVYVGQGGATGNKIYLNATIPLTWPPGSYTIGFVFHDRIGRMDAAAVVPVTIQ